MASGKVILLMALLMLGGVPALAQAACIPGLPCPDAGVDGGPRPKFTIDIKPVPKQPRKSKPATPKSQPAPRAKSMPHARQTATRPAAVRAAPEPSWLGLEVADAPLLAASDLVPSATRFIVRLDPRQLAAEGIDPENVTVEALAARFAVQPFQIRSIQRRHLPGFVVDLAPGQGAAIAADPLVLRIVADTVLRPAGSVPLSWGLDRLDQPGLPLDGEYRRKPSAGSARVYLLDSGVDTTHPEFEGRILPGIAFVPVVPGAPGIVCRLHGTAMASLIGGRTMGVAPDVDIIDVTILPCLSGEAGAASTFVEAMHWVVDRELAMEPRKPAIINLSLAGPYAPDVNDWIAKAVDYGIAVVAAAGNEGGDACRFSPASAPGALTVAASDAEDRRARFSNGGACVDIDAPGALVTVASPANHDRPYASNGTSAAAAHVSGVLARNLNRIEAGLPGDLVLSNAAAIAAGDGAGQFILQADAPLRFDCQVAEQAGTIRLRARPGSGNAEIARAVPGERLERVLVSGDWARIRTANGLVGWAPVRAGAKILLMDARDGGPCR